MKVLHICMIAAILAVPALASAVDLRGQYESQLVVNYEGMTRPDVSLADDVNNLFSDVNKLPSLDASDGAGCVIELAQYRAGEDEGVALLV